MIASSRQLCARGLVLLAVLAFTGPRLLAYTPRRQPGVARWEYRHAPPTRPEHPPRRRQNMELCRDRYARRMEQADGAVAVHHRGRFLGRRRRRQSRQQCPFSSSIFGRTFGTDTLAVTTVWTQGGRRVESDVIFNSRFNWDSYRGPLRTGANNAEFSRVALHEFGHVLGLDHPDTAGQFVSAIMNSRAGALDALTQDDRDGAAFLYASNAGVSAPVLTLPLVDQSPVDGDTVDFSVAVSGAGPFTYRWSRDGMVQGVSTAQWTLSNVAIASSGRWTVTITNSRGAVSSSMTLTVTARAVAPTITRQPPP